jgi:2-oxoglutarate dehydrogenase E2 component (dihydrolipoamide succinyltransferase)
MPVSVTMPRLGESVTEGTVTRWLKREGERVEADEPLLEVSTDKVDTEIPAPASGVLTRIVVNEDETAEVGSELAVIGDDGAAGGEGTPGGSADGGSQRDAAAGADAAASGGEPQAGAAPAQQNESAQNQSAQNESAQNESPEPAGESTEPAVSGASTGSGGGTEVTLPALGESVTEGTITRWLKSVGDTVEADEPLLEVSTDKVDTEIPAPAAGTLLEIRVTQDETAPVGAVLAVIGSGSGGPATSGPAPRQEAPADAEQSAGGTATRQSELEEQSARTQQEPARAVAPARAPEQSSGSSGTSYEPPATAGGQLSPNGSPAPTGPSAGQATEAEEGGGYVTPLVRKLAAENGVDLSALAGTGVGGRIRKQDVLDAAERAAAARSAQAARPAAAGSTGQAPARPKPSPLRGQTEKMSRMRSLIAKRMVESLQTSAQLTTVVEVDVTRIARLRDRAKDEFQRLHGVKLSFMPFFALAAIDALRAYPVVNASINADEGTVTYHDAEHLGVAVDTDRGLMVPVVHNAGDLNLAGLAKRIADLADRTRAMKVDPDDLSGGTFTLTNTGSRGALFDTPIINQPQVAILGTGSVVKRAVVVDDPELGEVFVPRSMVYLALSYDHRLVDGADAARFLSAVKERLEHGAFEGELGLG